MQFLTALLTRQDGAENRDQFVEQLKQKKTVEHANSSSYMLRSIPFHSIMNLLVS